MHTPNLLGLTDYQKNYTFDYSYMHSTYYYIIKMAYSSGTGVVENRE